jgi:hypothetical protein
VKHLTVLAILVGLTALTQSAFGNSVKCSNADQSISYDEWWYSGGAPPPTELKTHSNTIKYKGRVVPGAELVFNAKKVVVESRVVQAENISWTWYGVGVTLHGLPQVRSIVDFVICERTESIIPPP